MVSEYVYMYMCMCILLPWFDVILPPSHNSLELMVLRYNGSGGGWLSLSERNEAKKLKLLRNREMPGAVRVRRGQDWLTLFWVNVVTLQRRRILRNNGCFHFSSKTLSCYLRKIIIFNNLSYYVCNHQVMWVKMILDLQFKDNNLACTYAIFNIYPSLIISPKPGP